MSLRDQIEDAQKACKVIDDPVSTYDKIDRLGKWIAEANHHDGCACLYYVASSETWLALGDKPCTCGRDALLKAWEDER
jgi:hypothetical protein